MRANLGHLSVGLVVDDDSLMLKSVARALSKAGVGEVRQCSLLERGARTAR